MSEALSSDAIAHHFGGGVYAKETRIPAGMELVQHKHAHDHLSLLAHGRVVVTIDGVPEVHEGPKCLTIRAGHEHGVRAITDVLWFCIWPVDEADQDETSIDEAILARR